MPCLSQVADELKELQEAIQKRSTSPLHLPDDEAVPAESNAINLNGKLSPRRSHTSQNTSRRSSILHHSESLSDAIDGVRQGERILNSFDATLSQQDAVQSLLGKNQETQASVDDCNQMQQQAALHRARLREFLQEKADARVSGTAKPEVTSDQGSLMTMPPNPLQTQPTPFVLPFTLGRKGPMFKSSLRDCHGSKGISAKEHVQALPMHETTNAEGKLLKSQSVGILKTTQQESLGPLSCNSPKGEQGSLTRMAIPPTALQAHPTPITPPFPLDRKGPMFKSSLRDCHGSKGISAKEHVQALPMHETTNAEGKLLKSQSVGILKTTQQESMGPLSFTSLNGSSAINSSKQDIYFRAAGARAGAGAGGVAAAAAVERLQKSRLQGVLDFSRIGGSCCCSYVGTSLRETVGSPRDAAREWLESARVVERHCSSRMSSRSTASYDPFMAAAASGRRGATNNDRSAIYGGGGGGGAGNGDSSRQRFPFPFINDLVLAEGPRR